MHEQGTRIRELAQEHLACMQGGQWR